MLQEDGQYVEPLFNLAVRVDQIAVVHCKHVIYADVHVDSRQTVLVLEQGHLDGRYVAQSAFLGDLLDDFTAVFDELVLIVGHATVEDNDDVYVTAAERPEPIHARTSRRNCNLTLQEIALRSAVTVVECVLDPFDDLVPRLEVIRFDALLFVDVLHNLLGSLQSCRTGFRFPAIQTEHHVRSSDLLILFNLLA